MSADGAVPPGLTVVWSRRVRAFLASGTLTVLLVAAKRVLDEMYEGEP